MSYGYQLIRTTPLEIERNPLGVSLEAVVTALALVGMGVLIMLPDPKVGAVQTMLAALAGMANGHRAVFIKGVRRLTVVEKGGARWLVADRRRVVASAIAPVQLFERKKETADVDGDHTGFRVEHIVLIPFGRQAIQLQANNRGEASQMGAGLAKALGLGRVERDPNTQTHLAVETAIMGALAVASGFAAAYYLFGVPADAWSPVFAGGLSAALSVVLFVGNFGAARYLARKNLASRLS